MLNCPACGAWALVLETRDNKAKDTTRRRYECANFHRFSTVEQVVGSAVDAASVSSGGRAVHSRDSRDVGHGRN